MSYNDVIEMILARLKLYKPTMLTIQTDAADVFNSNLEFISIKKSKGSCLSCTVIKVYYINHASEYLKTFSID